MKILLKKWRMKILGVKRLEIGILCRHDAWVDSCHDQIVVREELTQKSWQPTMLEPIVLAPWGSNGRLFNEKWLIGLSSNMIYFKHKKKKLGFLKPASH